jgi:hypothetical protein
LLLAFWLHTPLLAYTDSDFDGVEDSKDRCPGTPLEDLVDPTGCVPKTGISLYLGGSRSRGDYGGSETITTDTRDLQLAYANGSWYATLATSTMESALDASAGATEPASGMGDTYLGLSYTALLSQGSLGFQGVVKLPTADEGVGTGNRDIGGYATLAKMSESATLFTTLGYLITGDDETNTYNDVASLNVGAGTDVSVRLFASLSAGYVQPLIEGVDASVTLMLFMDYRFDDCWFLNGSYTKGFSDSVADQTLGFMAGYAF